MVAAHFYSAFVCTSWMFGELVSFMLLADSDTNSHRWITVPQYNPHRSSRQFPSLGARIQHSPGPAPGGCWVGFWPRTWKKIFIYVYLFPLDMRRMSCRLWIKYRVRSTVSYVWFRGVPSTHFHCPSTPPSFRPIHASLSLLYKPLMKFYQKRRSEAKRIAFDWTSRVTNCSTQKNTRTSDETNQMFSQKLAKFHKSFFFKPTISSLLVMMARSAPLFWQNSLLRCQDFFVEEVK